MLGGLGQLFKNPGRLYIYPFLDFDTGHVLTVENFPVAPDLKHLYAHLRENRFIQDLSRYDADSLRIRSGDLLEKVRAGDPSWEKFVPPAIVEVIKKKCLFGLPG